jgi:hypothetical protein
VLPAICFKCIPQNGPARQPATSKNDIEYYVVLIPCHCRGQLVSGGGAQVGLIRALGGGGFQLARLRPPLPGSTAAMLPWYRQPKTCTDMGDTNCAAAALRYGERRRLGVPPTWEIHLYCTDMDDTNCTAATLAVWRTKHACWCHGHGRYKCAAQTMNGHGRYELYFQLARPRPPPPGSTAAMLPWHRQPKRDNRERGQRPFP